MKNTARASLIHAVGVLSLLISGCTSQVDLEAERQNLLDADRQFAALSVSDGAAEAFNQFLSEEALQLPAGGLPIQGRDAIYQQMLSGSGNYVLDWIPQRAEVAAAADMGWTWGRYILTSTAADGQRAESHGKYLNVWQKSSEGKWEVLVDMGNENPVPE